LKVDCTEAGKDTCSKFGVSGYPTLKIFRNGVVSKEYNGPRDSGNYKLSSLNYIQLINNIILFYN